MSKTRSLPKLTAAQARVLKRMPDRPSDGARMKGPNYMAALSCVSKGWAVMVGRRAVGGNFARLPAGRDVLGKLEPAREGAVILGLDPRECDGIYPRTRDGRCQGCGIVGEHPQRGGERG